MAGWLKIHRELKDKPIWLKSTPEQKTVLITLLMMVNHRPAKWEWKGQHFQVEPGQKITSLDSIVKECGKGITIQNVRSSLKRFEKLGFLTNESTKTGRLITIVKWHDYQIEDIETNKDNNKDPTKTQQRPNKEVTTNKNNKKEKKKKKKEIRHKYGEYKNVLLTDAQHKQLLIDYGEVTLKKLIKTLDEGIEMKGYEYTNYSLAIRSWARNDGIKKIKPVKAEPKEIEIDWGDEEEVEQEVVPVQQEIEIPF